MINRECRRRHYSGFPDLLHVSNTVSKWGRRLYREQALTFNETEVIADRALIWIRQEGRQPTMSAFAEAQRRRGRLGNLARRSSRAPRDELILQMRAGGESFGNIAQAVSEQWPELTVSLRRLQQIATPSAVALWWDEETAKHAFIYTLSDDSLKDRNLIESSNCESRDGEFRIFPDDDQGWIIGLWEYHSHVALRPGEEMKLRAWADDDTIDDVDLVRIIENATAQGVRSPMAYAAKAIANLTIETEPVDAALVSELVTVAGLDNAERAIRYAGEVAARPRAYLRTCITSAKAGAGLQSGVSGAQVGAQLVRRFAPRLMTERLAAEISALADREITQSRTGYLDDYGKRYGRLPWETADAEPETLAETDPPEIRTPEVPVPIMAEVPELLSVSGGTAVLVEAGRCPHPLSALVSASLPLDTQYETSCSRGGCAHQVYSDRPRECPCHLPSLKAAQMSRILYERAKQLITA